MGILLGVPFYIYIACPLEKAVFLLKHMILTSATNTLPRIIHAWGGEPDTLDEPKLYDTTHMNKAWVERSNVRPSTQKETHISS